jgi:predicted PurR-regulated permease PerM
LKEVITVLYAVLQPLAILVVLGTTLAYVLLPIVQRWRHHRTGDD